MTKTRDDNHFTRREVLKVGGVVATVSIMSGCFGGNSSSSAVPRQAGTTSRFSAKSFDEKWSFFRGAASGAEASMFDDSTWRVLDVPHDWRIEDLPGSSDDGGATSGPTTADGNAAEASAPSPIGPFDSQGSNGKRSSGWTVGGEGWYRKSFDLSKLDSTQRVEIRFDGVYENSDVWLNGKHLGFRPYGYSQFTYDLTPFLVAGKNLLAVRVRNLGHNSRWYAGSGIYRHTWLTMTDGVHVPLHGVALTTPLVSKANAAVRAAITVRNDRPESASVRVRTTLLAPDGDVAAQQTSTKKQIERGQEVIFELLHELTGPALWSTETPSLYRCRTEILIEETPADEVWDTFGVRSIEFDDKGFRLNGVTTKLRGTNIHHDHGALGAVSLDRSEERRVEILKAAGFNALRLAHNPHNPRLLDICDRLGMLVYDELFDGWNVKKDQIDSGYYQQFDEWWPKDLATWVKQGINHPSVVIRSIGNEVNLARVGEDFSIAAQGKELADAVRAIDSTRPIVLGGGQAITPLMRYVLNDSFVDVLDTHYLRTPELIHLTNPGKAVLCSESFIEPMDVAWDLVEKYPWYVGDFSWTGWDYLGEAGAGRAMPCNALLIPPGLTRDALGLASTLVTSPPYPWVEAGCGDHDSLGRARPQMLYRRVVWGDSTLELLVERPSAFLQAAAWSWYEEMESWTWPVDSGTNMTVRAYTTGNRVQLLLNGTQVSEVNVCSTDRRIATFTVPYQPGELVAVAYAGSQEIGRKKLETVGAPSQLRLRSDVPNLTTSRDALAHVFVEVLDDKGRLCPDAVVKVSLDIVGGTLVGFGNGNPHNVDSFQRPRRWTYLGGALAIIRPPKQASTITITASAADLKAVSITLPVVSVSNA